MHEQCPGGPAVTQNDAMIILAPQAVEPPRPDRTGAGWRRDGRLSRSGEPDLVIAADENQAHRPAPGVIVQTAIGVGIDETVQIGVPA